MSRTLIAALSALVLALAACASAFAREASAIDDIQGRTPQTPGRPVQVFDVKAGKVVRSVPNDAEFQQMAREWLRSVTGLSPRLQPGEDCGFVYRVPLTEPVAVRAGGMTITVRDVFLFHCERKKPLLLVFDSGNRPYLLNFEADLRPFLRKLAAPEAPPRHNPQ